MSILTHSYAETWAQDQVNSIHELAITLILFSHYDTLHIQDRDVLQVLTPATLLREREQNIGGAARPSSPVCD